MGFFFVENKKADKNLKGLSQDFLRRHECNVCPLNSVRNTHPKMEPTGSDKPEILIIGEAPGRQEDERGKQFIGKSGQLIRRRIPRDMEASIRWTNAIRCRPPDNRTPDSIEMSCCYPKLQRDTEQTKPRAIFGFGAIPLYQIVNPDSKHRSISLWRGRKLPVKVGNHVCWYFPFYHPAYVLRTRRFDPKDLNSYGSDEDFAFAFDLKQAFAAVENLPEPVIHTVEEAQADIELVYDINRIAELLDIVGNDPTCGVDLETNALRPYTKGAKILTMACSSRSSTFAFPIDHPDAAWTNLERKQLQVLIKRFLYESKCRKIVHHLPFELEWFGYFFGTGCFYSSVWECSESQAYILDGRRGGLSLGFLCITAFGLDLKSISGLDRKNLEKSPVDQVLKYNALDARYHRLLYIAQLKRIKAEKLTALYEHQMRRIPALVLATMQGVPIDQSVVKVLEEKYGNRLKEALRDIENDTDAKEFAQVKGWNFNPLSPRDVNILLREILKVDAETTSKGELEHIDSPIAQKIIACREAQKVLSTYINPVSERFEDSVLFPDGMIHPIISTTTVITWRTCVAGDTILETSLGNIEISKLDLTGKHKNALIKTHKGRWQKITKLWYKGKEPMLKLTFASGENIRCTERHGLLTKSGWKRAGSFRLGDEAISAKNSTACLVEITAAGIQDVWDISVEGDHSYLAQGLIHHNSSEDPNIQNWPKRDEERKEVRGQVKHKEAHRKNVEMRIVSFDYAGIQARNVAMESKDKTLVEAYWHSYDIHKTWMEKINKAYPKWIPKADLNDKDKMKAFRHLAKNKFVFPSFFGAQPFSISASLNIPQAIIEGVQEEFFDLFHDIAGWHKALEKFYFKNGYVTGLSGFRRYAPVSSNERINCVDTETECLTEHGWKTVEDLKEGMLIYTKNAKTGELELKPILKVNRAKYCGPVHVLNGTISSVTTHNHRWLVDYQIDHGKNNGGLETVVKFVESIDLTATKDPGKYKVHLTADRPCLQTGKGVWTDDEVRLIGWVLTDGCFMKVHLRRKNKDRVGVSVQQSIRGNPQKVAVIDALFDRLSMTMRCQEGIKKLVNSSIQDQGNYKSWVTYSDLAERIVKALPDKTLTWEFLQQLSTPQLQILFDTMLLGDGSWDKANNRYGGFTASSKKRIDAFSMLCVLLGQPHRIIFNPPKQYPSHSKQYASMNNIPKVGGYWTINLNTRKRIQPGFYASWKAFDGEVWCPATVNQTFVARRKGSVYITGNTPIQSDEAVIVMDAMARLSELQDPRYQAMLMVHDDLTFLMPKAEIERRSEVIIKTMVNCPFKWTDIVPLEVEMSVGVDWINMDAVGAWKNDGAGGFVDAKKV